MKIYKWPKNLRTPGTQDFVINDKVNPKFIRMTYRNARKTGREEYKLRNALVELMRTFK